MQFNVCLKNHRKDENKLNSLVADQRFKILYHYFYRHAPFTLLEQLENINKIQTKQTQRLLDVKTYRLTARWVKYRIELPIHLEKLKIMQNLLITISNIIDLNA